MLISNNSDISQLWIKSLRNEHEWKPKPFSETVRARSVVFDSLQPYGYGIPTKSTGVGRHFLLQGIFPTQGLKPRLLHLWRRQRHPTPALLPGKSQGQRSLVGCSPWGCEESETAERLHFHTLEKEMAIHSSTLAWKIPWTEEPDRL